MKQIARSFINYGGDIIILIFSVFLALLLRFGEVPTVALFAYNLGPFVLVFPIWIVVFSIAGFYNKYEIFSVKNLIKKVIYSALVNLVFSVFFFYLFFEAINPKTILVLVLLISSLLMFCFRFCLQYVFSQAKRSAVLVASGLDAQSLFENIKRNTHSSFEITYFFDTDVIKKEEIEQELRKVLSGKNAEIVIIQSNNPYSTELTSLVFEFLASGVQLFDFDDVYEDIFGKIALSTINDEWLVKNISHYYSFVWYDIFKRTMDIIISVPLFLVSLIVYPFVSIIIYLQDGGPVFIKQKRVGKYGSIINLLKFRSMKVSDGGIWLSENDDRITPFGKFIRNTRIDELPQLLNVIRGDLSLIGPRPDIVDLGEKLKQEISFYGIRTIVKPGLSGWAQIRQELPPQSVEETKIRFSYDCYYIKHRSLVLDLSIALSTVRILLSRTGK